MERSKKTVLGIDIGGTKIRTFHKGRFTEFPTPKNKKDFVKLIGSLRKVDAVGIACTGVIEGKKVEFSPNIKYLRNYDFSALKLGKIKVENDACAFLRAELLNLLKSDFNRFKRVLGITVGTGIGRAFSLNGKIKKVKKFEYPESWEKEYQIIRDMKNDKLLVEYLGKKLNAIIQRYKPKLVILGGGVMNRKGFFEKLRKELNVRSIKAKFGVKAGAIGAVKLWN